MKTLSRWALLFCVIILGANGLFAAEEKLWIKGSDTIGGQLAPNLAVAFRAKYARIPINIDALGSATAFVGLFNGSADIGNSSRPINSKELETAKELNIHLIEAVIGYDGVAVIVHPSNPVSEVSIEDLSNLFTGKVTNWKSLGGPNMRVRLLSRPSYSGTHSFFKEKAIRRGNAKGPEEFAVSTEFLESNPEIIRQVESDPAAISYVGLGWVRPQLRVLSVKATTKSSAILPNAESVRNGSYPLYRPLFMYLPENPKPLAATFVKFTLSKEGAAIVQDTGFVPLDNPAVPSTLARIPEWIPTVTEKTASPIETTKVASTVPVSPSAAPVPEPPVTSPVQVVTNSNISLRITFPFGAAALTPDATETLLIAVEKLKSGKFRAIVVGHADSQGSAVTNKQIAQARAKAAADFLIQHGMLPEHVEIQGQGSDEPIATNTTALGRAQNRRVDVELVPR